MRSIKCGKRWPLKQGFGECIPSSFRWCKRKSDAMHVWFRSMCKSNNFVIFISLCHSHRVVSLRASMQLFAVRSRSIVFFVIVKRTISSKRRDPCKKRGRKARFHLKWGAARYQSGTNELMWISCSYRRTMWEKRTKRLTHFTLLDNEMACCRHSHLFRACFDFRLQRLFATIERRSQRQRDVHNKEKKRIA